MNVWLARAALRTRGLSAGAFRVLLAHADACPPSGRTCLPGLEELAEACELSPKHVLRLRAQLVAAGHLRKLAAAHPGQRPIYEVLPNVPIPVPGSDRMTEPQQVAISGRTDAVNGSQGCDPPYKPQGITPPTPPSTPPPDVMASGGRDLIAQPTTDRPRKSSEPAGTPSHEAVALVNAVVTALRPDQQTRIDELGLRRLGRTAQPLVDGWTTSDLARRIAAERLDRAENLAAVLTAVLRRYALEPAPQELRAAERAERAHRAGRPPPAPCAHGDPHGCAACSFCRRGLADPGGGRCGHCSPSLSPPEVVNG